MKNIILFLFALSIFSCKKEKTIIAIKQSEQKEIKAIDPIIGSWVGDFSASITNDSPEQYSHSNKITIMIKSINGIEVFGQSVVAGNIRPFAGRIDSNGYYNYIVNELEDDKNDGVFKFNFKDSTITGIWIANNPDLKVAEREFTLKKQNFVYNPKVALPSDRFYADDYNTKLDSTEYVTDDGKKEYFTQDYYRIASNVITKINASTTKLEEKDVKNLKKLELEIIRNTIFARHGYSFKKRTYRQFFDSVNWYMPISNNVTTKLTVVEKDNIELLSRFEQYAKDNYDTFGR